MMDNLEKALSVLFRHVMVQDIIEGKLDPFDVKRDEFVRLMSFYSEGYSETELKYLYQYLTDHFWDHFYVEDFPNHARGKLNVFRLLQFYSDWILTEQDNEIVCDYAKFLHWRMITQELSEDLLVASFLALKSQRNLTDRIRFDWKAVVTHNNWELHKLLGQGMAENHSHLKGAFPVFQLTWVSIMNNLYLNINSDNLHKIDQNRRNAHILYKYSSREESFSTQLLQAACIRFLMFQCICHKEWGLKISEKLEKKLEEYYMQLQQPDSLVLIRRDLANDINSARNFSFGKTLPDYALAGLQEEYRDEDDRTEIFKGERWLIYHFLLAVSSGEEMSVYKGLFYAYLVIRENFRAEMVQNNKLVGFENFSIYEQRKDIFLETPFFKKELVKKAVEACLLESRVLVAEERIAPKASAGEICEYIKKLDQQTGAKKKYGNRFFYTVHFIKKEDKDSGYRYMMTCRHWKGRCKYKKEAIALAEFRERYPRYADRVRGIDAANMEIGCGPEVFAQVFRYLSDHRVVLEAEPEVKVPQLKITYHVGEDFLDLASGLRAIDEALHFLGMRCGDRLGHALALGIDVDEWYRGKGYRILLPQQEYLDNIAWMYHMLVSLHIDEKSNILDFLRKKFEHCFQLIYKNAMDQNTLEHIGDMARQYYEGTEWENYYSGRSYEFTIENYYSAWELRGDNPELYQKGFYAGGEMLQYKSKAFSYYAVNREFPEMQNKRYIQEIALLYYYYHFDRNVRREGEKIIEEKVEGDYIRCVKALQQELQRIVARKGIFIETNPSSNFAIGTFKRYDKHPITNFYNKYLVEDGEKLQSCSQLSVSINTDDAGIFNTSLQNEYAYMALAMEKAKDGQGNPLYKKRNVYEWLDHIRRMGLQQTFLSAEEMEGVREYCRKDGGYYDGQFNHSSDFGLFHADTGCSPDRRIYAE